MFDRMEKMLDVLDNNYDMFFDMYREYFTKAQQEEQ